MNTKHIFLFRKLLLISALAATLIFARNFHAVVLAEEVKETAGDAGVSATSTDASAEENTEEDAEKERADEARRELLRQIEEKTARLEEINKELEGAKKDLDETREERRTLQRELAILQGNIAQLDLNIKADKIRITKLGLEIETLQYDLRDIQDSIKTKKTTIGKILVALQKRGGLGDGLLALLLRSESLAEGISAVQALRNLQNQLARDIKNLRLLHERYLQKTDDASKKRVELEFNQRNLEYRKAIASDQSQQRNTLLVQTKNRESEYQKQLGELQKLQEEVATEIEALDAVLRTQIDPSLLPPLGAGVLGMPVKDATKASLTQNYGSTDFAKHGYRGQWHNGIDFRAPLGTPILAANSGKILAVGDQDKHCNRGAYGKFIVIEHENNLITMYAHLSKIVAEEGGEVERGEVVGYSGSSGYATGAHLHFTVYAGPTFYIGPSRVCGPMPHGGDLNPLGYL